jgi:hypothetical protein
MRAWHLLVATGAVAAAAGALAITLSGGSSQATQVTLDGVPAENLAAAGVKLLETDEKPAVNANGAEETAKLHVPPTGSPVVKETLLVRFVNDGADPPLDLLAWAVNFDPKTVSAVPPLGPGQYGPFCGHPAYHVVFIDAKTGEFLAANQRGGKNDADSEAGCPTPDPDLNPSPSPGA